MKKALPIIVLLLGLAPGLAAQNKDNSATADGQDQSQDQSQRPRAHGRQEYDDYNSAYAQHGGSNAERAANGFATRYPESELRTYLYVKAMRDYQAENNSSRMLAMGEKVLTLDPDNSLALVLTATALADGLSERDHDRDKKVDEIGRNATRALQTINKNFVAPPSVPPDLAALYKTTLESMAWSALGVMKLKLGDDAGAEKDLTTAAGLEKIRPDPYIWYHLALAQDHRRKYRAALNSVDQALQLASSLPELQKLAENEHTRLTHMARGLPPDQEEPQ